jgi:hypothetical protein
LKDDVDVDDDQDHVDAQADDPPVQGPLGAQVMSNLPAGYAVHKRNDFQQSVDARTLNFRWINAKRGSSTTAPTSV